MNKLTVIITALAISSASYGQIISSDKNNTPLEIAIELFQAKNYEASQTAFKSLMDEDKNIALYYLGRIALDNKKSI